MIRQFIRFSFLATAFASVLATTVACSSGGGGGSNAPAATDPNQKGGQQSNPALEANAWCNNYTDQTGNVQERMLFKSGGTLEYTRFDLVNGQRLNPQITNSQWSTLDNQLAIGPAGKAITGSYRIDPQDAVTQAKKLHFVVNGQDLAMDPCI